jgi:uncharacterized membrane protein YozB (DUF420 family)/cytochrome oxidase Cu insertion factor (SCO1/SenC/PrrC family)
MNRTVRDHAAGRTFENLQTPTRASGDRPFLATDGENRRRGLSTLSFIAGSVLWILVLAAVWTIVTREESGDAENVAGQSASSGDDIPEDAVEAKPKSVVISFPSRKLPEFEFPECMGGTISRDSLLGKRWLASFVFTRCVETCPVITRSVSELHTRVAKSNPDFRFVTFSVDSSFDTAEVLKNYAETFRADHERWKFLTGDENTIHDLIRVGFTQYVKINLGEMRKPGFEVAHSNRAVLVNEEGIPVATYLMTDPEHVVRLRRVIEGKDDFPQPGPALTVTPADGENPTVPLNLVPVEDSEPSDEASPPPESSSDSADIEETKDAADSVPPQSSEPAATEETAKPEQESGAARNEKIEQNLPMWVSRLPTINAVLNSLCTMLLIAGYIAIRSGRVVVHRNLMVSAFAVSVVFLACYVTYHEALFRFTGERGRAFLGSVLATLIYRSILIPHVILAVFVPVLAIRVFVHAYRQRWPEHRRLAKITLPIWLFVSITGVVIYWMLYHWPWRNVPAAVAFAA